jgi:acetyl/propionyl-CoA carboxylase alpha subunit
MKLFAHSNGHDFELDIEPERDRLIVRFDGREVAVTFDDHRSSIRTAFVGNRRIDFGWDRRDGTYSILIDGIGYEVVVHDPKTEFLSKVIQRDGQAAGAAEVRAPIPGLITKVLAAPGERVRKGQPILCLDAMKLENEIGAPRDGRLKSVEARPGQPVEKGQLLFVVE